MYKLEIILNNFSFYYFSQVYLNNLIRLKNFQDANVQKIEMQFKLGKSFSNTAYSTTFAEIRLKL